MPGKPKGGKRPGIVCACFTNESFIVSRVGEMSLEEGFTLSLKYTHKHQRLRSCNKPPPCTAGVGRYRLHWVGAIVHCSCGGARKCSLCITNITVLEPPTGYEFTLDTNVAQDIFSNEKKPLDIPTPLRMADLPQFGI